jgi:hypothetical protein
MMTTMRIHQAVAACLLALAVTGCSTVTPGSTASPPATSASPAVSAPQSATSPPARPPSAASPAAPSSVPGQPAPHQVHDPGHVTGTLTGPCHARGTPPAVLPDPSCTPGAYDPAITAAVLCAPGYSTRHYRPPVTETARFKFEQAYPAYGIPAGTPAELDHLIPLELGGANDAANLWPEAGLVPNPKDHIETALHDAVCSGRVSLEAAQRAIAMDWVTAEARLGISGG